MKKLLALIAVVSLFATVESAQAETKLAVQNSAGTADKFVVTDTGYIGINTTAPSTGLNAKGSYADTQLRLHSISDSTTVGGGLYGLFNRVNGSLPLIGSRLGYLQFGSLDPVGSVYKVGGAISAKAEASWTSTSVPTYFTIETAGLNQSSYSEKVRVTGSGNMGIGTRTPVQKLDVNGGIRMSAITAAPACNVGVRGTFWFTQGALGVADMLQICAKDSAGTYLWRKVTTVP